jgi:serine/threonine protein kinase
MTYKEQIIEFFISLFKRQCSNPNLGPQSQEYELLPKGPGGEEIYELRVRCGTAWETRRMSLSQLSEAVESKSTCFKVIYDDQMVIKIPPKPFTDFNKYLNYIKNERHIVSNLTPAIRCLSPSLSAMLNKVPGLKFLEETDENALEEKYIHLLTIRPQLQQYLKIGDGFVFFMHLAKSSFLNQVIEKIHDKTAIQNEMLHHAGIFEDIYAFEALYGGHYEDIFFKINELYHQYKKIIDILLPQYENYDAVPTYKKQEWFYCKLAGEKLDLGDIQPSEDFSEDLNQMLDILMEEKEAAVFQYRSITEKYIEKKIFDNNRKAIEGLIINILNLLRQLKNQHISIRDLKPDNIFISAGTDNADSFLGNPDTYSLGLIDLETAVHLHPNDIDGMKQPLLAGTFPYMTPHHLFVNKSLHVLFGDELCRVLYMQDWYAAIGMIFNVATGKILFGKTARVMQKIFEIKKNAVREKKPLAGVLKSISWNFWNAASAECHQKTALHKDKLSQMQILLPEPVTAALRQELHLEEQAITAIIDARIRSKPFLKKRHQKLMTASSQKIAQYRTRWAGGEIDAELPLADRDKMISIMKGIESLKAVTEGHENLIKRLNQEMTCDELIIFLFNRVLNAMYRQFWTHKDYPGQEFSY